MTVIYISLRAPHAEPPSKNDTSQDWSGPAVC